jgi:hypothetical protein
MGQIVKQVGSDTTRYYWYPGDKREYLRSLAFVVLGAITYVVLHLITHTSLLPAVAGTSVTALLAGFNFGRRDSRAIAAFAEAAGPSRDRNAAKQLRRTAVAYSGRAAWRGFAEGTGGAAAAVLIVNLSATGFVANWLLPIIPAALGALAHQMGMVVERLGHSGTPDGPAKTEHAATSAEQKPAEARAVKPIS